MINDFPNDGVVKPELNMTNYRYYYPESISRYNEGYTTELPVLDGII